MKRLIIALLLATPILAIDPCVDYSQWHDFRGGIQWRFTATGVEAGDKTFLPRSDCPARVAVEYGKQIDAASKKYGVPAAYIIATICTESGGNPKLTNPRASDCQPGSKVAVGLMQMLLGTAKTLAGRDVACEELMEPGFAIDLGARYMRDQIEGSRVDTASRLDPPKVAAAWNAGGVYASRGGAYDNEWNMRSEPGHIDRYLKYFNGAMSIGLSPCVATEKPTKEVAAQAKRVSPGYLSVPGNSRLMLAYTLTDYAVLERIVAGIRPQVSFCFATAADQRSRDNCVAMAVGEIADDRFNWGVDSQCDTPGRAVLNSVLEALYTCQRATATNCSCAVEVRPSSDGLLTVQIEQLPGHSILKSGSENATFPRLAMATDQSTLSLGVSKGTVTSIMLTTASFTMPQLLSSNSTLYLAKHGDGTLSFTPEALPSCGEKRTTYRFCATRLDEAGKQLVLLPSRAPVVYRFAVNFG